MFKRIRRDGAKSKFDYFPPDLLEIINFNFDFYFQFISSHGT